MARRRLSSDDKAMICARQNWKCPDCARSLLGAQRVEYDHVTPLALGGADDVENIQCLHARCHRKRTDSDIRQIRKADRQGAKTGQRKRRLMGSTRKIPSRPFGAW